MLLVCSKLLCLFVPVMFCTGCYKITTVFSHAQTVVLCVGCSTVLCQPTGGKARLTEGKIFKTLVGIIIQGLNIEKSESNAGLF